MARDCKSGTERLQELFAKCQIGSRSRCKTGRHNRGAANPNLPVPPLGAIAGDGQNFAMSLACPPTKVGAILRSRLLGGPPAPRGVSTQSALCAMGTGNYRLGGRNFVNRPSSPCSLAGATGGSRPTAKADRHFSPIRTVANSLTLAPDSATSRTCPLPPPAPGVLPSRPASPSLRFKFQPISAPKIPCPRFNGSNPARSCADWFPTQSKAHPKPTLRKRFRKCTSGPGSRLN